MDYYSVQKVENFKAQAERLGLTIKREKYYDGSAICALALVAKDDNYPSYNRESEFKTGTVETLCEFMNGLEFAKTYYGDILKLSKQIEKAENKVRNRKLMQVLQE